MGVKRTIIILFLIAIAIIAYVVWEKQYSISVDTETPQKKYQYITIPETQTKVPIDDVDSDNLVSFFDAESNRSGMVSILRDFQIKNGEKIVVPVAVDFGGTGKFLYIIEKDGLTEKNYFVGDRIIFEGLSFSDGNIYAEYLSRKDDEPFIAEPTVPAFISILDTMVINVFGDTKENIFIGDENSVILKEDWLKDDKIFAENILSGVSEKTLEIQAKKVENKEGFFEIKIDLQNENPDFYVELSNKDKTKKAQIKALAK